MRFALINIRNMMKQNAVLLFLIVFSQIVGVFLTCFSVGVIMDSTYSSMEDINAAKTISLSFKSNKPLPGYVEVSDALNRIYDRCGDSFKNIYIMNTIFNDSKLVTVMSMAERKNGEYVLSEDETYNDMKIYEGRNITNDDIKEKRRVCVVSGGYKQDKVVISGIEFEIVGRKNRDESAVSIPSISIPITAFEGLSIASFNLQFDRVLSLSEYNYITDVMTEAFPDSYIINDYNGGNADTEAVFRSVVIAVTGIIVVMVITLAMLHGYVFDKRKRQIAIMKLCGGTAKKTVGGFILEGIILSVPSCFLGTGLFFAMRFAFLDKYYKYMPVLFGIEDVFACTGLIIVAAVLEMAVFGIVRARRSLKEQLRESSL